MNDAQSLLRHMISQSKEFNTFMKIQDWREYAVEDQPLEIENVARIIEHVRSESQTYFGSSSLYLSALVGAITGTVFTIVLTQFASIVNFFSSLAKLI